MRTRRDDTVASAAFGSDEGIRAARRRATGLLVVVSLAYLVVVATTDGRGAAAYVRAGLEAAMVGGLADWFAVVAIFRHPLGIPIPHTAVIVRRKDAFASTLGGFVGEHLLNADTISSRVATSRPAERLVEWALRPGNPDRIAGHAAELVVRLAAAVEDDDLVHVAESEVRKRLAAVDVAPLAARLLGVVTEEGRHRELVDALLRGVDGFLAENEPLVRERFLRESPWWVPEAIDDRIFERLLQGVRAIIRGDTVGGSDELRGRIDAVLDRVARRLADDEVWRRRAEELRDELLDHPALRGFLDGLWADTKDQLARQATDDGSELRARLTATVRTALVRFRDDPAALARVDELAVSGANALADTFGVEIADVVTTTVQGWDAEETAGRLEALLGRDLQFIRINGTVVGGLAGLAIHAIGELVGGAP